MIKEFVNKNYRRWLIKKKISIYNNLQETEKEFIFLLLIKTKSN
jgi:hypothetical protein